MNQIPEHLDQLLSQAADGSLTPEQRAELDRACASDARLAAELRRYQSLARLLCDWRKVPIETDHSQVLEGVRGLITRQSRDADAELESTLAAYRQLPDIDWDSFHARVTGAIRKVSDAGTSHQMQTTRQRSRWRLFAGGGTPLAAAAAVLLVVFLQRPDAPNSGNGSLTAPSMVAIELAIPRQTGRIEFNFATAGGDESFAQQPDDIPGSAIAVGPGTLGGQELTESALLF
jgi:anti-sigma factor RsiW